MGSSTRIDLTLPHLPVLAEEVLESFDGLEEGWLIDCTVGYGGHSEALLRRFPQLRLVGIDRDPEALEFSAKRLQPFADRVQLMHGAFSALLPPLLQSAQTRPIVGVLADFGVSSLQLDKRERGFSFESERLDMRMDPGSGPDARDLINHATQTELARIFREYGEISRSDALAREIVRQRSEEAIESGKELAQIAKKILPQGGKIHPATLLFQALRIAVNDELGEIERMLEALESHPPHGAVVSLITFHSLEDRLVKNHFRQWSRDCLCPPEAIRCTCGGNHALGKPLRRKPVTATPRERAANPRSRSAKLRSFRFSGGAR